MRTEKAVLGALAGLALGAMAGILFAPQKGSKTRKRIMGKGDHYVNKLKSKFNKFSDSLTEKYKSTKKNAEKLAKKQKAEYDDAIQDVKKAASNFKHSAS